MRTCLEPFNLVAASFRFLKDIDWVEHVQRSWQPMKLGKGFQVLLPWHEGPEGLRLFATLMHLQICHNSSNDTLPFSPRLGRFGTPTNNVSDIKSIAAHVGHLQGPCSVSFGFTTSTAAGGATSNGRRVLRLEGGAAFGLGDHPTTQGAVEFLEKAMGCETGCMVYHSRPYYDYN